MATLSIRFIHERDVKRWEKLEARGKLGPRQRQMLEEWRRTNCDPACNAIGRALIENARQQVMEDNRDDYLERQRLANQLSWASYYAGRKSVLSRALQNQSLEELGARYKELCNLIPEPCGAYAEVQKPGISRFDEGWLDWERKYGAEVQAISQEIMWRRRRVNG